MYSFKALLATLSLFCLSPLTAQVTAAQDTSKNYVTVETEAFYPGGDVAWQNFLQKNINPNTPKKNKAPIGRYITIVKFIVDTDGSVSNIEGETTFGFGMEEEVIRVLERSGKWGPAMRNGKPLKAYRRQPITFILQSDYVKISTVEPFTLFVNNDNFINITINKMKLEDISIYVEGGKSTLVSDGRFNVRVSKPGRVRIKIVNNKKDDKEIETASFEVKSK